MKLGFIGTGNMAGAILAGICQTKAVLPQDIYAFDIDGEKTKKLKQSFGIQIADSAEDLIAACDAVLLGLKPQHAQEALSGVSACLTQDKTLISIVTGLSIGRMKALSSGCKIVRVMPNTPALCGKGVFVIAENSDEQMGAWVRDLLTKLGTVLQLPEELFPAATAITGSGPAYVFMFLEGMTKAAVGMGIPEESAKIMACQTLAGASVLAENSEETLLKLRQNVCSPGGTTIEGVKVMEEAQAVDMIQKTFLAAYGRALELEVK